MAKNLNISPRIEELIKAAVGDDEIDLGQLSVFEAFFANTRPISKRGSIFDGAQISRSTLTAMAEYVNTGNSVPLHTLHRQSNELPVGRVFHATVEDDSDGNSSLRGLFYIPTSEEDLIAGINIDTLDEVSVGLKSKKLLCSDCGFDFFGPDAGFMHLFDRTCDENHTVGEDGCHVQLVGLDLWAELSLVSKGAANNPKILSRSKAIFDNEIRERLAASGVTPEAVVLFATCKEEIMSQKQGNDGMATVDVTQLIEEVVSLKADATSSEKQIVDLTASIEVLTAERDELKKNAETTDEELKASFETAKASLEEITAFLTEHTKAALVASGQNDPKVPEDAGEMIKAITEAGVKLHQVIGAGAQSSSSNTDVEDTRKAASFAAFKTRR